MDITPEFIGTAIGVTILIVTGGLKVDELLKRRRKKGDSDEHKKVDNAMDIAVDYRERLETAESKIAALQTELDQAIKDGADAIIQLNKERDSQLQEAIKTAINQNKLDCAAQIEATRLDYERQLAAALTDRDEWISKLTRRINELEQLQGDGK